MSDIPLFKPWTPFHCEEKANDEVLVSFPQKYHWKVEGWIGARIYVGVCKHSREQLHSESTYDLVIWITFVYCLLFCISNFHAGASPWPKSNVIHHFLDWSLVQCPCRYTYLGRGSVPTTRLPIRLGELRPTRKYYLTTLGSRGSGTIVRLARPLLWG